MVHFQTDVEKMLQGAAASWGGGIFQDLVEHGQYWAHPILKIAIGLVFQISFI